MMDFQLTGSPLPDVCRYADISPCGLYRYSLTRVWANGRLVAWVMLNPSTADAREDDPTIRKVMGFSKAWGYAGCVVVNLFALRSTDPRALQSAADPFGPENHRALDEYTYSGPTVAAWGDSGGRLIERAVRRLPRVPMLCLGTTKSGNPRHPCRLAYSTPVSPFEVEAAR